MTSSAIYDDNRKEEHKYFLKALRIADALAGRYENLPQTTTVTEEDLALYATL